MSIYYVAPTQKRFQNYNMSSFELGGKTVTELRNIIAQHPEFCRDEKSIFKYELSSYLSDGITLYAMNDANVVGILNFDINGSVINIMGICVPPPSTGVGTALIDAVKKFAKLNSIQQIRLTCYDSRVADFYRFKNGFRNMEDPKTMYDSDDEEEKIKYDMMYLVTEGGTRRKNKRGTIKINRKRNTMRKRK